MERSTRSRWEKGGKWWATLFLQSEDASQAPAPRQWLHTVGRCEGLMRGVRAGLRLQSAAAEPLAGRPCCLVAAEQRVIGQAWPPGFVPGQRGVTGPASSPSAGLDGGHPGLWLVLCV